MLLVLALVWFGGRKMLSLTRGRPLSGGQP
jgi:hypothetical protein